MRRGQLVLLAVAVAALPASASASPVTVLGHNGHAQTVLSTSASFGYGVRTFTLPKLSRGTYGVRLAATDLAGNLSRITGSLQIGS